MKLDEFITSVLIDINNGIKNAKDKTGRNYIVSLGLEQDKGGINFDIAVVAGSSSITQSGGAVKAGFVEVLAGKVETKREDKEENSRVSRIQFTVSVPHLTDVERDAEHKEYVKGLEQASHGGGNDLSRKIF